MAGRTGKVAVSITADPSGLERGLRGAEGDLKRLDDRGSKSLHGLKVAALAAGAAITTGVVIGLKQSVDAAVEAQKSQSKMETQLKALGISYRAHAAEIENVIQKTSKLAGLDDEDLQDAFTGLVRATGSVNTSLKDMALVADLARARHMDVAKAGELVAKVHAGNVGALKRLGIAFDPVTKAQDALKEGTDKATVAQQRAAKETDKTATSQKALALLQQKFAGQAAAYGKTAAGAQDRFAVATENLKEAVGAHLLPTLTNVAEAAAKFVGQMESGKGAGGDFVHTLKDVFGIVKTVGGALLDVGQAVLHSKVALIAFGTALVGLAISRTVGKVKDLAEGFSGLTRISKFTALTSAIGLVATAITLLSGNQKSAKDAAEDLTSALDDERDSLKRLRDLDLDAAQAKLQAKQSTLALKEAEKALRETRKDGKASADDVRAAELNVAQARIQAKRDTRALDDVEGDANKTRRDFKAATDRAASSLEDHAHALQRDAFRAKDATQAQKNLAQAFGELKAAQAIRAANSIAQAYERVAAAARQARSDVASVGTGGGGSGGGNKTNPGGFGANHSLVPTASPSHSGKHPPVGYWTWGKPHRPGWGYHSAMGGPTFEEVKAIFAPNKAARGDDIRDALSLIDAQEAAGVMSPGIAEARRGALATKAAGGEYGGLSYRDRLEFLADKRTSVKAQADRRKAKVQKTAHAAYNKYAAAMAVIDEKEAAGELTADQAEQWRLAITQKALDGGFGGKMTAHERRLVKADQIQAHRDSPSAVADSTTVDSTTTDAGGSAADDGLQATNALLQQQLDLMKQARDEYQKALNVSQSQYDVFKRVFADIVSGEIGGRMGLGFQTPGFAGGAGLARY